MLTHLIAAAHFHELAAGYGSPEAMTGLFRGQLSKRLLMLREVLSEARSRGLTAATGADRAAALIAAAQRRAPDAAGLVLNHPFFDAWATRCLRELRSGEAGDLAHLSGYAAAAAVRAGLDFEIRVLPRDGVVHLPSLGAAAGFGPEPVVARRRAPGPPELSTPTRTVQLDAAMRTVQLDADTPGWTPVRVLTAGLTLAIEDLDPYRDLFQWPVTGRLDEESVDRLRRLLAEAWAIITRDHPEHAPAIRAGLRALVPLASPDPTAEVSAASRLACGSIGLAIPADADTLATLIIHEFEHMKLGALLDLAPLYRPGGVPRHRAPWRADPRPVGALLQGAYAHLGVTDCWRMRRRRVADPAADIEFGYWLVQTIEATAALAASGELTPAGERFVSGMAETLAHWRDTEVLTAGVWAAVADMDRASAIAWRLRNLAPDPERVAAWCAGDDHREWTDVAPGATAPAPARLPRLAALVRQRAAGDATQAAEPAARAYLDGDWAGAVRGYRAAIAAAPADLDGWVGLALAANRAEPDGPLARALATRPEVLRAAYRRCGEGRVAHDVDALAARLTVHDQGVPQVAVTT